jgi:hypothetical protein
MDLLETVGIKNLLSFKPAFYDIITNTCSRLNFLCKVIFGYFVEDSATGRIAYEELLKNFRYAPSGSSTRNVNHWVQMYASKQWAHYDLGKEGNLLKYGQEKPPAYKVEAFKKYRVKSYITVSDSDPFSKKEDCEFIFRHMSKDVLTIRDLKKYNHLDYLWSNDAKSELYHDIINFLRSDY